MARITAPALRQLDEWRKGRRLYQLTEDLLYGIESPNGPTWLTVPEGFKTDLESIPMPVQWLAGWAGYASGANNTAAPVIHDWLYQNRGKVPIFWTGLWTPDHKLGEGISSFSRKAADDMFLEILLATGTRPTKARVMHWAVSRFGGRGWGS